MECDGTAPPTEGVDDNTMDDKWNTAGPVEAPGDGAAAAAAKAAEGETKDETKSSNYGVGLTAWRPWTKTRYETSPSSSTPPFSVGPCVKNPDGGMDC